jgi:hypothetical protein
LELTGSIGSETDLMKGKAAILEPMGREVANTDLMNGKAAIVERIGRQGANTDLTSSKGASAGRHSRDAILELTGGKGAAAEPMGSRLCAVTALRARGMRWVGAYSSTQLPRRHRPQEAEQACRRYSTFRSSRRERPDGAWMRFLRSGHTGLNARR